MNLIQTVRKGCVVAGVALEASVTTVALAGPAVAGGKGKTVEYVAGAGRIERADVAGRAAAGSRLFAGQCEFQVPVQRESRSDAAGGGLAGGPTRAPLLRVSALGVRAVAQVGYYPPRCRRAT